MVETYGTKGQTPVIPDKWHTQDHLSVIGGITPAGKVYTLVCQVGHKALTSEETLLEHILRCQTGKRLLIIWDGSPIHRWECSPWILGETEQAH